MSWDATLYSVTEITRCGECGHELAEPKREEHEIGWWNYTRNVTPMIFAAYEAATGKPLEENWWRLLDGMAGPESVAHISAVITGLEADPARFRAMNPPNGWGAYDGGNGILKVLRDMRDAVPQDGACVWRTSG